MDPDFRAVCDDLRRDHARRCFRRAVQYNQFAHNEAIQGRSQCFQMKARCIERAIRLAPEALYVDDFQLAGGGVVGITFPGLGRLHIKLGTLSGDIKEFIWRQIKDQCSPRLCG